MAHWIKFLGVMLMLGWLFAFLLANSYHRYPLLDPLTQSLNWGARALALRSVAAQPRPASWTVSMSPTESGILHRHCVYLLVNRFLLNPFITWCPRVRQAGARGVPPHMGEQRRTMGAPQEYRRLGSLRFSPTIENHRLRQREPYRG